MNLKCIFKHQYQIIAVNQSFCTNWTNGHKDYHYARFYACERCSKRTAVHDGSKSAKVHPGLKFSIDNWIETGALPSESYHPNPVNEAKVIPFKIVDNQ